jgi:hypothetical protein
LRLYANENFPLPVVIELRRLGHDVLTTSEAGAADRAIPDEEVLAFSISERRALLTLNRRHFVRLHNANADHTGIIVCTFDASFADQASRIHQTIGGEQKLDGRLLRVNRPPG